MFLNIQHNLLIDVSNKQVTLSCQVISVQTIYKNIFTHDRFTSEGTNKELW